MNAFLLFLSTAVTALAVENAVFARGLGLGTGTMFMKSARQGILLGAAFTWMALLGSLLVAACNAFFSTYSQAVYTRPLAYLVSVLIVYAATILLCEKSMKNKALTAQIVEIMPVSTFNSALFAIFYLSASQSFSLIQIMGYALGAGVGYTGAVLIIYQARKRLSISPVPRSFRGLPALLVYLGLVSLAIYGLIGHSLPT